MARQRRAAYRKGHQNRFSMFLVSLVVLMMVVMIGVRSIGLQQKMDAKAAELEALDAQIEAEKERTQEIEEFAKEVQTKGYIESIARERLGLVYEGEILLKQDN